MIGDRYDIDLWNCTHEVAQWYQLHGYDNLLKGIPADSWDISFVRWMRRRFDPLERPEQAALVLMHNRYTGGLHVGVWDSGMVHHCYQPPDDTPGQTIRTPIGIIKTSHKNITFWRLKSV